MTAGAPVAQVRQEVWILLLLGLLAMGFTLRSGWVQDDPPLIERNARAHEASGLWSGFTEAYWPPPSQGGLYRPLARSAHTALWLAGGGSRVPFVVANLALFLLAVLAVWLLACELLPRLQAFAVSALFAAHPVHLEAVATAMNQGESVVVVACALSAVAWIRRRRGTMSRRNSLLWTGGLYLLALGFKEHALVLPLLLAAIELILPDDAPAQRRTRWLDLGALALVGAAWWTLRASVLGGLAGAAPVEGLRNEGIVHRALTMLGVVPEWGRLLFWPARMQGDYSPWEIHPFTAWAGEQSAGLILLVVAGLGFLIAWKRDRIIALAIAWMAIALAPVSNLLIPTGILLAERTLFLASVGAALLLGRLLTGYLQRSPRWSETLRVVTVILILLGIWVSARRSAIYRDRDTYLAALRHDAPDSWRVMVGAGIAEMESGHRAEGERLLAEAHAAWPASPRPIQLLAFYHRLGGRCAEAVPYLEEALHLDPADTWTRLPYVTCLLDLGRYADAKAAALAGGGDDMNGSALRQAAVVADSALLAHAPAHTVRLPPIRGGLTLVGTP